MVSGAAFTSGRQESLWLRTQPQPVFAQLSVNTAAEVCVIGGGLAGLTTAYLLAREGASVLVLEAVCPHLKCIVGWNAEEQSWVVLNGPANTDLSKAA